MARSGVAHIHFGSLGGRRLWPSAGSWLSLTDPGLTEPVPAAVGERGRGGDQGDRRLLDPLAETVRVAVHRVPPCPSSPVPDILAHGTPEPEVLPGMRRAAWTLPPGSGAAASTGTRCTPEHLVLSDPPDTMATRPLNPSRTAVKTGELSAKWLTVSLSVVRVSTT